MDFQNKWKMSQKENVFVAKRNIIDYIWKSANLEGIGVTYPDTETICEGMTVEGYSIKDTLAVNNLKHAWMFVLNNIDYPMDYAFICKVNQIVGQYDLIINAGYIRKIPVKIGGTNWQPDLPNEEEIKEQLESILGNNNPLERAIDLMLYCVRKQMFIDGNKRTSMLVANQIMIANGCGIISIPIEKQREFRNLLVDFYSTNDTTTIAQFILDECIDGMDFRLEEENSNDDEELDENNVTYNPTKPHDDEEDMEL